MKQMVLCSLLVGLLGGLASCEAPPKSSSPPAGELLYDIDRQTTSPELALNNLNAQIQSTESRIALQPREIGGYQSRVDLLLLRAQFRGRYSDFALALQTSESALESAREHDSALILHAQVLSTLHRFDEALELLDEAAMLGADTISQTESILLAKGQGDPSILLRRQQMATDYPSYRSYTSLAAALRSDGQVARADEAYVQALAAYRDVSPFPLAWVAFQRGVMWTEEAGVDDYAEGLYGAALLRLPQYVVANVHLAEQEFAQGRASEAAERLTALLDSEDPEPWSRLAQFVADSDPERAEVAAQEARARYEALLADYELAFADHAAEFYMGAGDDPARALELALANLENRETVRAFELAIEAATLANDSALACELETRLADKLGIPADC